LSANLLTKWLAKQRAPSLFAAVKAGEMEKLFAQAAKINTVGKPRKAAR
jgi:hypothetical protein